MRSKAAAARRKAHSLQEELDALEGPDVIFAQYERLIDALGGGEASAVCEAAEALAEAEDEDAEQESEELDDVVRSLGAAREAATRHARQGGYTAPDAGKVIASIRSLLTLGEQLREQGTFAAALPVLQAAVGAAEAAAGTDGWLVAEPLLALARLMEASGEPSEAVSLRARVMRAEATRTEDTAEAQTAAEAGAAVAVWEDHAAPHKAGDGPLAAVGAADEGMPVASAPVAERVARPKDMRDGDAAEVGLHPLRAGLLQQLALLQIEADGWRAECEDAVRLREQLQSAVDEATLHMHRLKSAGTTVHGPGASPNGRTTEGAEMARDGEMSWGDFFGLLLRAVHREKAGLLQHIASARAGVEERRRRCTAAAADAAAEGRRRREEEAKAEHWRTTLERERAECERIERELKEAESEREQVTSRDATSESRELSIARDEMYAIVARRDAALSQLRERQRAMQVQAASMAREHDKLCERLSSKLVVREAQHDGVGAQIARWKERLDVVHKAHDELSALLRRIRKQQDHAEEAAEVQATTLIGEERRARSEVEATRREWLDLLRENHELLCYHQSKSSSPQSMLASRLLVLQERTARWRLRLALASADALAEATRPETQYAHARDDTSEGVAIAALRAELATGRAALARREMEETELTEDEAWLSSLGQAPANRPRQAAELAVAVAARKRETERLAEEEHALRQHVEEVERKQEEEVEALRARSDALRIAHDIAEVSLVEAGEARGIIATAEGRRARQVGEAVGETLASLEATRERLREVKTALQTEVDAARRMRGEAAQAHASAAADSAAGSEDADIQLYELLAREGAMAEKSRADMAAQQVQAAEAEATLRARLQQLRSELREEQARATEFATNYAAESHRRHKLATRLSQKRGAVVATRCGS